MCVDKRKLPLKTHRPTAPFTVQIPHVPLAKYPLLTVMRMHIYAPVIRQGRTSRPPLLTQTNVSSPLRVPRVPIIVCTQLDRYPWEHPGIISGQELASGVDAFLIYRSPLGPQLHLRNPLDDSGQFRVRIHAPRTNVHAARAFHPNIFECLPWPIERGQRLCAPSLCNANKIFRWRRRVLVSRVLSNISMFFMEKRLNEITSYNIYYLWLPDWSRMNT